MVDSDNAQGLKVESNANRRNSYLHANWKSEFRYARYSLNYDIEKYAVHEIDYFKGPNQVRIIRDYSGDIR